MEKSIDVPGVRMVGRQVGLRYFPEALLFLLLTAGRGGTDSGWQSLTNASVFTGAINYRKVGVFLVISTYYINLTNQLSENAYVTLGQLPSGYRPTRLVIAPCIVNNSGMANRSLSIMIWTDGFMQLVSNNEPVKTTYPIGFSGFGLV